MALEFANLAAVSAATISAGVVKIETDAYAVPGDLGGASYRRKSSAPAHQLYVQSADGAYWEIDQAVVPPEAAGAKGDGVTDDQPALQRWHSWANATGRRGLKYGPRRYALGGAGIQIAGSQWAIEGFEKATEIIRLTPGDCYVFSADADGGTSSFSDLRFKGATGAYTGSSAIHFKATTPGSGGMIGSVAFRRLNITSLEDGLLFDDNGTVPFAGSPVQRYFGLSITELATDGTGGVAPLHGVRFKAGTGGHSQVSNCNISVAAGGYAIRAGDGVASTGDFDVSNNQLLNGAAGIKIVGPSNPTVYNRKVSIIGNDIDGNTAYTFDVENLSFANISGNNMLSSVPSRAVNCFNMRLETSTWTETRDQMTTFIPYPANTLDLFKVVAGPETSIDDWKSAIVEIDAFVIVNSVGSAVLSQKWQLRRNTVSWLTPVKISESINPAGAAIQIAASGGTAATFTANSSSTTGSDLYAVSVKMRGSDCGYQRLI